MSTLYRMRDNAEQLGIDPDPIAVTGSSAGGGLSAAVARRAHDDAYPAGRPTWAAHRGCTTVPTDSPPKYLRCRRFAAACWIICAGISEAFAAQACCAVRTGMDSGGKDTGGRALLGLPDAIHACLFDLDGVLTDTASVHSNAWKAMFDAYLERRAQRAHTAFVPFDPVGDYRTYVDGKKRQDGVRSFLASRNIDLPDGDLSDPTTAETVNGLGNRKNALFQQILQTQGVKVFDGSRRYLEAVQAAGIRTAVVSSSANTRQVLEITGLDRFVQQRVDGVTIREENLRGKPAPDSFLRGAQLLDVEPAHAAVFEDALAGVAAGRAGNFGFVVGVDRLGQADALRRNGADVVVTDLAQLLEPQ